MGLENKVNVVVGVYYGLPRQNDRTDEFSIVKITVWIHSLCTYGRFQLPRHQLGIPYSGDKQVWEIPVVR